MPRLANIDQSLKPATSSGHARSITTDLLRGSACLMILVYHLRSSRPIGLGQASMEVFFVLSGYLIARSLAWSIDKHGLRGIGIFALRRIKRLLPAMLVFLIGALALNLTRPEMSLYAFCIAALLAVSGAYNFFQVYSNPDILGLGGIWSLSLEEQFYVTAVIFFLISCAIRQDSSKRLLSLALALMSVGLCFRVAAYLSWYEPGSHSHLSYLPPLRMWGFGIGAFVAYLETSESFNAVIARRSAVTVLLIYAGGVFVIMSLVASVQSYDAHAFLVEWAYIPVVTAVLVIFAARIDIHACEFNSKLPAFLQSCIGLGVSIFRTVGLASYSIYLWHCLVIAAFERFNINNRCCSQLLMGALSLLLGTLSWHLIEKRFYNFGIERKDRISLL